MDVIVVTELLLKTKSMTLLLKVFANVGNSYSWSTKQTFGEVYDVSKIGTLAVIDINR